MTKKFDEYYLGLDIGTDSVGYAVTGTDYALLSFKSRPMWGSHLFEEGLTAADRRGFRIGRRRVERRRQRVALLQELFTPAICAIDPHFFIRRKESALFLKDSKHGVKLFDGAGLSDKAYHKAYPTIHHLIHELMTSDKPHDVRLVYLACAWLVAHRGHFLFDVENVKDILDFNSVYGRLKDFVEENEWKLPWSGEEAVKSLQSVLQKQIGVNRKKDELKEALFGGKVSKKLDSDVFPTSEESLVKLLAGGKEKPETLFGEDAGYADVESVSLVMDDEKFVEIVSALDETHGELLRKLRDLLDCARLIATKGDGSISESKIAIYEQHRRDLKALKAFVRKYLPKKYDELFKEAKSGNDNYVSYCKNVKAIAKEKKNDVKFTTKEAFSDYLKKLVKGVTPDAEDRAFYDDMTARLESMTFLPRQKDTDNRVIPHQLWGVELEEILERAKAYLPFLTEQDAEGFTPAKKIFDIFRFKIPYFVGPLQESGGQNKNAWMVRKAQGKILPWNFEQMVDQDKCEEAFIRRMTNVCAYLPGEDVLPLCSLLYCKYMVLNELNNIKIDGDPITPAIKQELYRELFEKHRRVTVAAIKKFLKNRCKLGDGFELTGLDQTIKSSLKSYHAFKRLLETGTLTEENVEAIILRSAYTEDRKRMKSWLRKEYPLLSNDDVKHILQQNLKEFGRLSRELLSGVTGRVKGSDAPERTVIETMWETNDNLMQILESDRYTFKDTIADRAKEYYALNARTIDERLSDMYVSNAVKRPIIRTLDIVRDVVKATGRAPKKIFVEMARGGKPEQKGKRTESRKDQLMRLYKNVLPDDARTLEEQLKTLGDSADSKLQKRSLFLYYLQLGKCAYTGEPIELSQLSVAYDLDHIYPQCHVKDDSLLDNLVLVKKEENGRKKDSYPLSSEIQEKMKYFWAYLRKAGLMTEEKYRRLMRNHGFSNDEKQGFVNRQLVETRQSTKAVTVLLKELYPETEIVFVKAGMVSEFRKCQYVNLLKSRAINDLHHAKDAYLNVVVGNVYHERFTKKWFHVNDGNYNVQVEEIFRKSWRHNDVYYWRGMDDCELVKKTMALNAVHLTRYAFCRKGGLFDQQPLKAGLGQIPRKKGLPADKYGGYQKPTASYFILAAFESKKKKEATIVPVRLLDAERFQKDPEFAKRRIGETISEIRPSVKPQNITFPLGLRPLKIDTVFSLDGTLVTLSGSSVGGKAVLLPPLEPLLVDHSMEMYVKRMEVFQEKRKEKKNLIPDEEHDGLSSTVNIKLFDMLVQKLGKKPYNKMPGTLFDSLSNEVSRECFAKSDVATQIGFLLGLIAYMNGKTNFCDVTVAGGKKSAGIVVLSSNLSNWIEKYKDVRVIDRSASGLFEKRSDNLMDLLK